MTRGTGPDAVRPRIAVCLVFAALGLTNSAWSSRIPDIRENVGVDNAAWGTLGTASAVGDLVAILATMVLVGRVRTRALTRIGAALMLISGPLLAGASAIVQLIAGLVTWGFGATLLAPAINAQGVDVEETYGRRVVPLFHACFSLGVLVGGVYGAVSAGAGIPPGVQLAASTALFGALLLATATWLPNPAPQAKDAGVPLRQRLRKRWAPQLRLLALLAFVGSFIEGTVGQWSAIYATDATGVGAAVAAGIYTGFTVAVLAARLTSDAVLNHITLRTFLQCSLLLVAVGVATAIVWPVSATVVVGFALAGLGVGCVVPSVIRLAGRQPGLTADEGTSMVTLGQWPGFLLASPVIGLLAGASSLRVALILLILCGVLGALLARNLRYPEPHGGTAAEEPHEKAAK